MSSKIKYKGGYKYRLFDTYSLKTPILGYRIEADYISLAPDGTLTIKEGYSWDGASGPTVDTKSSMRGALVHDAFYQLERCMLIDDDEREAIDLFFYNLLKEDGMNSLRARLWYWAVRLFGGPAANPGHVNPPEEAP